MGKGVGIRPDRLRSTRSAPGRQLQQRLGRLVGEVFDELEQAVLVGGAHVGQPVCRNAEGEQLLVGDAGQGRRAVRGILLYLHVDGDLDLFDGLAHLHELGRAGTGMGLQPAALRPVVGLVVVVDVAEQQAGLRAVGDDANVGADACGQKLGSRARSSRWNCNPGRDGSIWRSKAVVLAAFCSSPFSLARLSLKVSAMRKSMTAVDSG